MTSETSAYKEDCFFEREIFDCRREHCTLMMSLARDAIITRPAGISSLGGMVGPAHPPGMGLGSLSGCFGLPNWVLGCTHGLRASAWASGAGTKALFLPAGCPRVVCGNVEAGGRSPGRVPGVTPWGLSVA